MITPLFPVPPEIFGADVSYNDFEAGETMTPKPGITLRTTQLNHPDNAPATGSNSAANQFVI